MNPEDVLSVILASLDDFGIPYMVTGSFAGNVHGIPRATHDADIVVEATETQLRRFVEKSQGDFYVHLPAALDALRSYGMFNMVHLSTGFKVDMIIRKPRPFSQEEFQRRKQIRLNRFETWFASAEDVILTKLEWSQTGNSERQFLDAVNIARVQDEQLDRAYLKKWAPALNVTELLDKLFMVVDQRK